MRWYLKTKNGVIEILHRFFYYIYAAISKKWTYRPYRSLKLPKEFCEDLLKLDRKEQEANTLYFLLKHLRKNNYVISVKRRCMELSILTGKSTKYWKKRFNWLQMFGLATQSDRFDLELISYSEHKKMHGYQKAVRTNKKINKHVIPDWKIEDLLNKSYLYTLSVKEYNWKQLYCFNTNNRICRSLRVNMIKRNRRFKINTQATKTLIKDLCEDNIAAVSGFKPQTYNQITTIHYTNDQVVLPMQTSLRTLQRIWNVSKSKANDIKYKLMKSKLVSRVRQEVRLTKMQFRILMESRNENIGYAYGTFNKVKAPVVGMFYKKKKNVYYLFSDLLEVKI